MHTYRCVPKDTFGDWAFDVGVFESDIDGSRFTVIRSFGTDEYGDRAETRAAALTNYLNGGNGYFADYEFIIRGASDV